MAGSLGDIGVFSFHPRKSITTGEGGMLTTNDDEIAERARLLRNHGASISEEERHVGPKPYLLPEFNVMGFNYRMTDIQGAVGLVQLNKLDGFLAERRQWASFYESALAGIPWLRTPVNSSESQPGWQAYVCHVDAATAPMPRNELMEWLQARGISTRPGTHAIHNLGYYQNKFGFSKDDFPGAYESDSQTLAIPLHNRMTAEEYQYVVAMLYELNTLKPQAEECLA
jgi:dTDP-4-amino-4,6-dideoxygalactose transaminase